MPRKGENVYHRKDGLWEARYVKSIDLSGKKKYASVYAHSCREAKEKRQLAIDSIRLYQATPVTRGSTVTELVKEWLIANEKRLKPSTFQKYQTTYEKHIKGSIGEMQVVYCTTAMIQAHSMKLIESGMSPVTVNSVLILLHSCLKYGHRVYGFVIPDIIYQPVEKKEMRVLDKEEHNQLVEYLMKDLDIYKFGVLLTLYTGLRVGELCGMEWEDVKEDRIIVRRTVQRMRNKDGKGTRLHIGGPKTLTSAREIPLPSFLLPIISEFRTQARGRKYLLSHKHMNMIEPRTMQYNFNKYVKEIGLKNVTFHTLRHTFATRCAELNFEIKSLSEVLGHSDVRTTLTRYVHSSFELKAKNMELLTLNIGS